MLQDTPPQSAAVNLRTEFHSVASCTPSDTQLLNGRIAEAPPVQLAGALCLPAEAREPLPAVLLLHGSGGLGSSVLGWQAELSACGLATFAPDCFSGRGISRTVEDQGVLPQLAMTIDAMRALEFLRRDRRLDPHRIAVIGFSRGGLAALAVGQRRLQRLAGLQGEGFAAAVAFYPSLWLRLHADLERDAAPVLVLQGDADDYVGVTQLQSFSAELEAAGAPLQLHWLPGAGHVFDGPLYTPPQVRPLAQTLRDVQIVEGDQGVLLNSATGRPFSWSDPEVGRGATVSYDPAAHAESRQAVLAFLERSLGITAA